jgi:tRNA threonylcarbamoyladenosine biosynthesis protein TsaB
MSILALEFSSAVRSVAIFDAAAQRLLASVSEKLGVKTGMALIDDALRQAGLEPAAITQLAIGLGPGSHAGVRSSIAIAQGWRLAREIPVVAVSSVDILAETARQEGRRGTFTLVIDAQRGELYRARYELTDETWREVESLRIVPATAIEKDSSILGPGFTNSHPSAESLARLAPGLLPLPPSDLEPIYLREISFVKAAATRNY